MLNNAEIRRRRVFGGAYDFAKGADGAWDPQAQITYSGPKPVSMADQSPHGRPLTYRYAAGSATADTFNGRAVVRFPGATPGDCVFYSDAVGALIGAGTNVPWTASGCFMLDPEAIGVAQTFMFLDSSGEFQDNHKLSINAANQLSLFGNVQSGTDQYHLLSAELEPLVPYSYVLRVNANGTLDFWLNGWLIDTGNAYGGTLFPAITRFAVGASDYTTYAPSGELDGILGPHRFDARAITNTEAHALAGYLHGVWSS